MKAIFRFLPVALLTGAALLTTAQAGRNPADGEARYMQLECKILPGDGNGATALITAPFTEAPTTNLMVIKVTQASGAVYETERHLTQAILASLRSEVGYQTALPKGGVSCKANFKSSLPLSSKKPVG